MTLPTVVIVLSPDIAGNVFGLGAGRDIYRKPNYEVDTIKLKKLSEELDVWEIWVRLKANIYDCMIDCWS